MRFFIVFALVAAAAAQVSNEYLPPHVGAHNGGGNYAVESHSVEISAPSYNAPVAETHEVEAVAPSHSFSDADGYRYKTQRRRVYKTVRRNRRDVSNEYLPPIAVSEAVPEVVNTAPATDSYETVEAAPAHSFSEADGYRYKTHRRRVIRRQRRDVSLEYLPPVADQAADAAPVESYETVEAAPAHTFSDADGYRYKTLRRRVVRRQRRDVSLEYLPPVADQAADAAPAESYETIEAAPAHTFSDADGYRYKTLRRRVVRRQRRDVSLEYLPPVADQTAEAAPAESYETVEAIPAHTFSDADGYRYKTLRRRVVRRQRRDVSLEYLPPVAEQADPSSVESYEVENAAPAHSFSEADGYRYKTQRRRVIRRN